jgi:hypothetical protein
VNPSSPTIASLITLIHASLKSFTQGVSSTIQPGATRAFSVQLPGCFLTCPRKIWA